MTAIAEKRQLKWSEKLETPLKTPSDRSDFSIYTKNVRNDLQFPKRTNNIAPLINRRRNSRKLDYCPAKNCKVRQYYQCKDDCEISAFHLWLHQKRAGFNTSQSKKQTTIPFDDNLCKKIAGTEQVKIFPKIEAKDVCQPCLKIKQSSELHSVLTSQDFKEVSRLKI